MTCAEIQPLLPDYLAGSLLGSAAADLQSHLAGCAVCGAEVATLSRAWEDLGLVADEMPSERLRTGFYRRLQQVQTQTERAPLAQRLSALVSGLWLRPAFHLAAVMGALAIGYALGGRGPALAPLAPAAPTPSVPTTITPVVVAAAPSPTLGRPAPVATPDGSEVRALREEVRSLGHLVALSLLRNESAADRLQGVSYSRTSAAADPRVLEALIEAASHDANDNVRLAAIDALAPLLARAPVRERLLGGFDAQRSPLVQIALVDAVAASAGPDAEPALRALLARPGLPPAVRLRLQTTLGTRS